MAIAVTTPSVKVGFIDNATSINVSGCEVIHAAVVGKKIKIRHLTINSTSAISITIGEGETASAVDAALIGPLAFDALQTMQWDFNPLLELTENTLLSIDADGAGVICVFVQGVIE
jgi:hypothetical protein